MQGTRDCFSYRALWIQRRVRILEDHLQLLQQLSRALLHDVRDIDAQKFQVPGIGWHQTGNALGQCSLAASGFTHDT